MLEIKLVPGDINRSHQDLTQIKQQFDECKTTLTDCYTAMKGQWIGAGGNAFEAYFTRMMELFGSNIEKLEQFCNDLKLVEQHMHETDVNISENFAANQ